MGIKKNEGSKVNIHIYPSNLTCETRIEKITTTLIEKSIFDEIIVIGTKDGETQEKRTYKDNITFILKGLRNIHSHVIVRVFVFLFFYLSVFVFCMRKKNLICINAHSLSVLPLCYLVKLFRNSKLVYDTHELETESNSISGTGIRQKISKLLERILIKKVDYTIVVSESIRQWYQDEYGIEKIVTIFNTPKFGCNKIKNNDYFRSKYNIRNDTIIYIYVGGISYGRGIEILLDVFTNKNNRNACVIFMGEGPLVDEVEKHQDAKNIFYHEQVPTSDVISYTSGADIGISYIENTSLSYYFSMPNKIFEYLFSSLPVITSNMLESSKFVRSNSIGCVVEDGRELLDLVENLNREQIVTLKDNIPKIIQDISWDNQEDKIESVYKSIL